jgi:hypothetical protein
MHRADFQASVPLCWSYSGQREYAAPGLRPPRHCAAQRFVVFNARRAAMMGDAGLGHAPVESARTTKILSGYGRGKAA